MPHPVHDNPKAKRVEVRSRSARQSVSRLRAMLMPASTASRKDGSGRSVDKDLYICRRKELKRFRRFAIAPAGAEELNKDRGFLKVGGVFDR